MQHTSIHLEFAIVEIIHRSNEGQIYISMRVAHPVPPESLFLFNHLITNST